jgi:hypothetical protein
MDEIGSYVIAIEPSTSLTCLTQQKVMAKSNARPFPKPTVFAGILKYVLGIMPCLKKIGLVEQKLNS